jgi:hypothetical protein
MVQHPAGPRRARPRCRDVAIDCVRDDREIAADDGRRCARGEARRPTDATEARATSRGFDVARAGATRTTDANGRRMRERFQSESLID